jgi:hypothetical protein
VPPIGALAERVRDSGAGWIMTEREWRDENGMLDRLETLLAAGPDIAVASTRARALPQATLAQMAQATFALYDATLARTDGLRMRSRKPLEPARLRYALGYVPWAPPPAASRKESRAAGLLGQIARAAAKHRNTMAGRALMRVAPTAVVARLRTRLK